MGDSQTKYNMWTTEESNELLKLMVNAAMRGWRDKNGMLNKRTVEKNIVPTLNGKLRCEKTFAQYQSRLKWFKQRYNNYSKLTRHSFGFGWDPETKKFTANDEKVASKIESIGDVDDNCWDAIKEVPNLENRTRYKVFDLLNARSKKMAFLKMTIEERLEWIDYKLNE
ncbi:uncharacterized protein At2g29880-like [Primulina tabacum]|uniref:uncharacterized protein At2g29880-like n=1 Tax=Primulina tabacum TaxID=48773 RepID=UPI003F595377